MAGTRNAACLAAFLAAGMLVPSPASAQTKSTKEDRAAETEKRKARDAVEREIRDACANLRKAYENARAKYEGRRRRGASDELMEEARNELRAVAKVYYECLKYEYVDKRKMDIPPEYRRVLDDSIPDPRGTYDPGLPEPCERIWRAQRARQGQAVSDEDKATYFLNFCECLKKHAPDEWEKLCRTPASPVPGGSDLAPPEPGDPPPPPAPPPAPGAGTGSSGGGAGPGSGGGPPAPVPPATPTEVNPAPCVEEGATAEVATWLITHVHVNHDDEFCRLFQQRKRIVFQHVLLTSLLLAIQDLPSPLVCSVSSPGCAGSCEATFRELAGQSNVTVRLENLVLSSGRVQGTLWFGFPGQPFVVGFASP